jgi:phage I-like protein
MKTVARASFATAEPLQPISDAAAEGNLQWMPPGPQDITCWVNGVPKRLRFTVTARHAELLDAQLQKLIACARDGKGDKPLTDYNHDDGAASGRPTHFSWGGADPKAGGIRLHTKWTGKAKSSINDEEYDRFSPQWEFDENTGEIISIGVNLGGLVNKAAFKNISQVRARDASGVPVGVPVGVQASACQRLIGAAVEARAKPPTAFASAAAALEAQCRSPKGRADYEAYRNDITGNARRT